MEPRDKYDREKADTVIYYDEDEQIVITKDDDEGRPTKSKVEYGLSWD